MNQRAIFSIIAAGALCVAAITGASAAAIAASRSMPSGINQRAGAVAQPSPTPTLVPPLSRPPPFAPGTVAGRPLEPSDVLVTEKQIRAVIYFVDEQRRQASPDLPPVGTASLDIMVTEAQMDVKCMADKGYYYNPITAPRKLSAYMSPGASIALWGATGGGDAYRWQDAGCHGQSVHNTGNDNNN